MIVIGDTRLGDLAALHGIALALERWFPDHNSPFAYGTRLAEETGEFTEAAWVLKSDVKNNDARHHFVKEAEDILQIVMGVLNLYGLHHDFPERLDYFYASSLSRSSDATKYIIDFVIRSGEFANAINHCEGTGIKKSKHGDEAFARLNEKAARVVEVVANIIQFYGIYEDLERQIAKDYLKLTERGLIGRA